MWLPPVKDDTVLDLATDVQLSLLEKKGSVAMLYYALIFLVVALVAALFGFGGVAVAAAGIAKILFFIFLVFFVVSLIMHLGRRV